MSLCYGFCCRVFLLAIIWLPFDVTQLEANEGDPIAIRYSDGCFVIESMWSLSVQIVFSQQFRSGGLQGVDLIRVEGGSESQPQRIRHELPVGQTLDFTLDRSANQQSVRWSRSEDAQPTANAIRVRAVGRVITVALDGVTIAFIDETKAEFTDLEKKLMGAAGVVLLRSNVTDPDGTQRLETVDANVTVFGADSSEVAIDNTTVVNSKHVAEMETPQVITLNSKPLTLRPEVESLFIAKEIACRKSQKIFAELSASQLNFRPGNGSHTPRWNAEHMMGRELLFFSQIYNALNPAIPVMDLNPKQMPEDYKARHTDWDGMEEARQMERVAAFTSRFSYLLKNVPLDEKAPGSGWTLRALLRQMERHYSEHTDNVVKKFELDDWPRE